MKEQQAIEPLPISSISVKLPVLLAASDTETALTEPESTSNSDDSVASLHMDAEGTGGGNALTPYSLQRQENRETVAKERKKREVEIEEAKRKAIEDYTRELLQKTSMQVTKELAKKRKELGETTLKKVKKSKQVCVMCKVLGSHIQK